MATQIARKPDTVAALVTLWREFLDRLFDTYRPELHYMRGPGPKWREKHQAADAGMMELSDTALVHH